ncbi:MAG: DUF2235 domain-containing protein [Gammaproteobacteria bacterium]|nr:DUF2235 domain-containing protein [Gammaproteobacteria bacterium]
MKRIVICCDGTWNDLEMRYITNVGRLVQALLATGKSNNKSIEQMIYYDDGVGADANGLMRLIEGGTGKGIDAQIYNAYRFIAINYEPGDEICLFGFSRGAFAARSIAGMIGKVGLVPRSELKHLPAALDTYRSKNAKQQTAFKKQAKTYNDVKITLLGCWDTVGALGIPDKLPYLPFDNMFRKRYQFHDTNLGKQIQIALHAVAIDERRKEFNVTLMHKPKGAPRSQKLVQKWFPGDHGCVGGGTWEKRALSNHCLQWMVAEAKTQGVELGVDFTRLRDHAFTDHSIYFSGITSLIYGKLNRAMPEKTVSWDDIDDSARIRWLEHNDYRPPVLKRRFAKQLDSSASGQPRKRLDSALKLQPGKSADVRVFAREKNNHSFIEVEKGKSYQIEVSRLQVWKDGNLDACDIRGWNTVEKGKTSKIPYQDGEKANLGSLKANVIRSANKYKLVKTADWFELVVKIYAKGDAKDDLKGYQSLTITRPAAETQPYVINFKAQESGELRFAANDLSSKFGFIDKYDNNDGWVWLKVSGR